MSSLNLLLLSSKVLSYVHFPRWLVCLVVVVMWVELAVLFFFFFFGFLFVLWLLVVGGGGGSSYCLLLGLDYVLLVCCHVYYCGYFFCACLV